jgi:hypothetical protein
MEWKRMCATAENGWLYCAEDGEQAKWYKKAVGYPAALHYDHAVSCCVLPERILRGPDRPHNLRCSLLNDFKRFNVARSP